MKRYNMQRFRNDLAWTIRDIRRQQRKVQEKLTGEDLKAAKLFLRGGRTMFHIIMGVLKEAEETG